MNSETIMVFCAHNDDNILGAGGSLAQYASEGKEIITIIFSYGASSHPWLKTKEIIQTRVKESKRADKVLGIKTSLYLGLNEGSFQKEAHRRKLGKRIKGLIKQYDPIKIFTHSQDDPHPDHQAVFKMVMNVVDKKKIDVFTFQVWNPVKLVRRNYPKLIVDISKTLPRKVKAFKVHKSQKIAIVFLLWSIYIRALWNGMQNHLKYAEVFYKVR